MNGDCSTLYKVSTYDLGDGSLPSLSYVCVGPLRSVKRRKDDTNLSLCRNRGKELVYGVSDVDTSPRHFLTGRLRSVTGIVSDWGKVMRSVVRNFDGDCVAQWTHWTVRDKN